MAILEGKKTYIGLAVALIGVLGISSYITETETADLLNKLFEIAGILMAIYGRIMVKSN